MDLYDEIRKSLESYDKETVNKYIFSSLCEDLNYIGTLLSVLSDLEIQISSNELIDIIYNFLYSYDKRVAQHAAGCLYFCCGMNSEKILNRLETIPKHIDLIKSILKIIER
jgi:hypothetical protein